MKWSNKGKKGLGPCSGAAPCSTCPGAPPVAASHTSVKDVFSATPANQAGRITVCLPSGHPGSSLFWDGVLWVLSMKLEGREGVRGKPVPDSSNLLSLLAKSRQ